MSSVSLIAFVSKLALPTKQTLVFRDCFAYLNVSCSNTWVVWKRAHSWAMKLDPRSRKKQKKRSKRLKIVFLEFCKRDGISILFQAIPRNFQIQFKTVGIILSSVSATRVESSIGDSKNNKNVRLSGTREKKRERERERREANFILRGC